MAASVSAENSCSCALKRVALSPKKLCALSPMLVIVTSTMQNCPCAVVLRYWSPISEVLQSTPFTTKLNLPSAAGSPMPGLPDSSTASSTAGCSAGSAAADSSATGAAPSVETAPLADASVLALSEPP